MTAATATQPAPAMWVLSPSQVSQYIDCQARWYYSHVAKLPDPPSGSLAYGKAMHATAACYLNLEKAKIAPSAGDIGDYYAARLTEELAQAELAPAEDAEAMRDEGLRMLAMFTGQIAPQLDPVAVELQVHGLIGHQHIRGIVDVLDASGTVIDLKTASKKPGAISASRTACNSRRTAC